MQNFITIQLRVFAPVYVKRASNDSASFGVLDTPYSQQSVTILMSNTSKEVVAHMDVPCRCPENKYLHVDAIFLKNETLLIFRLKMALL